MSVTKPIFIPGMVKTPDLYQTKYITFPWVFASSKWQKTENVKSFHESCHKEGFNNILEVSTASYNDLGKQLSAFNLKLPTAKYGSVTLESLYQGSKVFENGGPFIDLYTQNPSIAKLDNRLKSSGQLLKYHFNNTDWKLNPTNLFYDWLYFNAIKRHPRYLEHLVQYDGFTDIMFNMNKSVNCQARSCAIIVSLLKRNMFHEVIRDKSTFIHFIENKVLSYTTGEPVSKSSVYL